VEEGGTEEVRVLPLEDGVLLLRYRVYILESLLGYHATVAGKLRSICISLLLLRNAVCGCRSRVSGVTDRQETNCWMMVSDSTNHASLPSSRAIFSLSPTGVDSALAADADGVHLGSRIDCCLSPTDARTSTPDWSLHKSTQRKCSVADSGRCGLYLCYQFMSIDQSGKAAAGLDYIRYVTILPPSPGLRRGIDGNNVNDDITAGAERVAVVRALMKQSNPPPSNSVFPFPDDFASESPGTPKQPMSSLMSNQDYA